MRQSISTSRPQQTKASKSPSKESVIDARTTESICSAVQNYGWCISVSVKDMYADCQKGDPSTVIFCVNRVNIPKRRYVSSRSYTTNPWFTGQPDVPTSTTNVELLESHFQSLSAQHLARNCIVHNAPGLVGVSGKDIMDQLVGNAMLDHELGCIILRRQNQTLAL